MKRKMTAPRVDPAVVAESLREIGVRAGDTVGLHSDMPSLGRIMVQVLKHGGREGLEQAVNDTIDGFLAAVDPEQGTLCVPTFTFCFSGPEDPVAFDPEVTPSKVGILTNVFFRRPDAVRSLSATHSVAAIGARSDELVRDHDCSSPLGPGTPFHRLAEWGGWICYLGTNGNTLSLLHVAEAIAPVPYATTFRYAYLGWRAACLTLGSGGEVKEIPMAGVPGCSEHFHRFDTLAEEAGIVRKGKIYRSKVVLFRAVDALELAVEKLRAEPGFLLCPKGTCQACDAAWPSISG